VSAPYLSLDCRRRTTIRPPAIRPERRRRRLRREALAWRAFPDANGEVTNTFESGDVAVLEITWSGTQSGPLEMPDGELPASNKRAEVRACQVFRVEGDRIAESRHYFDMTTLLQQVGAMEVASTG